MGLKGTRVKMVWVGCMGGHKMGEGGEKILTVNNNLH
jgi:hypothetical protein